jgi:hypothetical protein
MKTPERYGGALDTIVYFYNGGEQLFKRFMDLFRKKETDKSVEEQKRLSNEIFQKLVQLLMNDTEYASDKDPNKT